jgi:hypothetical protein
VHIASRFSILWGITSMTCNSRFESGEHASLSSTLWNLSSCCLVTYRRENEIDSYRSVLATNSRDCIESMVCREQITMSAILQSTHECEWLFFSSFSISLKKAWVAFKESADKNLTGFLSDRELLPRQTRLEKKRWNTCRNFNENHFKKSTHFPDFYHR